MNDWITYLVTLDLNLHSESYSKYLECSSSHCVHDSSRMFTNARRLLWYFIMRFYPLHFWQPPCSERNEVRKQISPCVKAQCGIVYENQQKIHRSSELKSLTRCGCTAMKSKWRVYMESAVFSVMDDHFTVMRPKNSFVLSPVTCRFSPSLLST